MKTTPVGSLALGVDGCDTYHLVELEEEDQVILAAKAVKARDFVAQKVNQAFFFACSDSEAGQLFCDSVSVLDHPGSDDRFVVVVHMRPAAYEPVGSGILDNAAMPKSLNLEDHVTPNHWDVSQFQPFDGLSTAAEFDLVAPVYIYFAADLKYRPQALAALRKLKKLGHPLAADTPLAIVERDSIPDGLANRYNALVMVLAESCMPGIKSHIDAYGAFAFTVGDDRCVMAGDSSSSFAYYLTAELVRARLRDAMAETA